MGDVVRYHGITTLDLRPDDVIEAAHGKLPEGVVIVGYTEGGEFWFSSSFADGGEVLWLLEKAKLDLFKSADDIEAGDAG